MAYSAKGAVAATVITQKHKGGRMIPKAFRLIGTMRFLADGMEIEVMKQSIDFAYRRFEAVLPFQPVRLRLAVFRFHPPLPSSRIEIFRAAQNDIR